MGREGITRSREELVGGGVDDDRPEATNGRKHRQEHADYDAKLQAMSKQIINAMHISTVHQIADGIIDNNAPSTLIVEVKQRQRQRQE
jgi:hypothetical protein